MKINELFYDIESLDNVFTCTVNHTQTLNDPADDVLTVYHLVDTPRLIASPDWQKNARLAIYNANRQFRGVIYFVDLATREGIETFARTFGVSLSRSINDKTVPDPLENRYRIACDTDEDYDPDLYPYIMGYNSYNYDTTMLALFFDACIKVSNKQILIQSTTAHIMRDHNNMLFTAAWKSQMPKYLAHYYDSRTRRYVQDYNTSAWRIRQNMLMTGRHIDTARLNEKQQHVALKRLLGMLGYQIKESNKLKQGQSLIETEEQFYDLLAYNASDTINLKSLMNHKAYSSQFALKRQMLRDYPELIYEKLPDAYKPDIRPCRVRRDRLYIDSSSAQLATKSLCPYGHLTDIPVVSFLYPAEEKAKELGIERVNVLDETRAFFHRLYHDKPEILAKFENVYRYYKRIEGRNFNDSEYYMEDYGDLVNGDPETYAPIKLSDIPKEDTFLPYFDRDGNPTSCYVIFSTGGIHGAEYNKELYDAQMKAYLAFKADMDYVQSMHPDPKDLKKAKTITMPDGRELKYNVFTTTNPFRYKPLEKLKPELYKYDEKKLELNKKYTFTSASLANHEDFESYYPNLLRMMMAFYNPGLGYDRYAEIFDQKRELGKKMKDKSYSEDERAFFSVSRDGTKLILNSASGAADAAFKNNIRVNNQIISMRIIGQLFSWRIGQAQAFEGAKMISTNTDGLYSVMEESLNNAILERESKNINVNIEPEPLYLISKDTNNRIELTPDMKILGASGGTVSCRKGPNPTKSLAHPAIIDWALAEYLIVASNGYKDLSLSKPFDDDIGMSILKAAENRFNSVDYLIMFQNIIAASTASNSYPFGVLELKEQYAPENLISMQHYNRVFYVHENTPGSIHMLQAHTRTITPAMQRKRTADGQLTVQNDPAAEYLLKINGIDDIPKGKEAAIRQITNLDPNWNVLIDNSSIHIMPDETRQALREQIDLTKYLTLLRDAYTNSWYNTPAK